MSAPRGSPAASDRSNEPEDRVAGLGAVRRVQRPEAVEVGHGDGDRQVGIEQVDLGGEPVQRQCPRVVGHGSKYGGATYIYGGSIYMANSALLVQKTCRRNSRCCRSFTQSGSSDRQAALTSTWHGPRIGYVITPDTAQPHLTLLTAAARFDELSLRDALASMAGDEATGGPPPLAREEAVAAGARRTDRAEGRIRPPARCAVSWLVPAVHPGPRSGLPWESASKLHGTRTSRWILKIQPSGTGVMESAGWTPIGRRRTIARRRSPAPTIRPGHQGSF